LRVLDTGRDGAAPIEGFGSRGATSLEVGKGSGESHVYAIHFDPGGEIGPHPAGFDQLFIVTEGSGWGAGADGVRNSLAPGRAAFFRRGEVHSKGSEAGMSAIMIQIRDMDEA
jgi:quercetin dioxygenase-like cupin family protein